MHRRCAVRSLLATGTTVGLAGCNVFLGAQDGGDDGKRIGLLNQTDRTRTVRLTVTEAESSEPTFEETIRVPEDDPTARRLQIQSGTYELVVNVVDGPRGTYQWDVVVGRDSGLTIKLFADRVEFSVWVE